VVTTSDQLLDQFWEENKAELEDESVT